MAFTSQEEAILKEIVRAINDMGSSGYGYKWVIDLTRREREVPLEELDTRIDALLATCAAQDEALTDIEDTLAGVKEAWA